MLNFQSYIDTMFPSIFGPYRMGRHVDGSRKTGDVMCAADTLVGVLMDAASWLGMFPGIVASANARHIATPITTSRHGMVIMIDAELRVLSPRVPVRKIKFLRHCRQVEPAGTWAVVDVSVDGILGQDGGRTGRLLPSGCLIQKRSNTSCKVTWIVNMEYEVAGILEEYHPFLRSGQALGACRWIACLQRQCAYLAIVHSHVNNGDKTRDGKMSIFDVARQMTMSFYEVVRGPWSRPWRRLGEWSSVCGVGVESFKVLARVVTFAVGNNGGDVLNVMAPVWLPGVPPQQVFDYLCDENRRGEWDSLANGAPVLREGYFPTGQLPGNAVSVLGTINASDGTPSGKVILQEACADTSCMVLAYTIMDEQSMQHAMNNGGPASLSLLPSGVVILPDGASPASAACSSSTAVTHSGAAGSFVSVMYQTLLSGQPPEGPSYETIDNAGNLLCRVIRKIKDAVHANSVVSA